MKKITVEIEQTIYDYMKRRLMRHATQKEIVNEALRNYYNISEE